LVNPLVLRLRFGIEGVERKYGTSRVGNPVTNEYPGRKELLDIYWLLVVHVTPKEGYTNE